MQKYFLLLFVLIAFCSAQKEEEAEECEEKNCEEEGTRESERSYRSEAPRYSSNSRSPNYYSSGRSFGGSERTSFSGTFGNSRPSQPSFRWSGSEPKSAFEGRSSIPERRESGFSRSFTIDLPFSRPEVPRLPELPRLNFPDLSLGDLASRFGASERRLNHPESRLSNSNSNSPRISERSGSRVEYVPAEVEYVQRKIELVPRVLDPEPTYSVQRDSGFSARSLPGYPDSEAAGRRRSTYESSSWGTPESGNFGSFSRSGHSTSSSSRFSDFFPRVSSRYSLPSDYDSRRSSRYSNSLSPYTKSSSSYSRYDGRRGESGREDRKKEEEENEQR